MRTKLFTIPLLISSAIVTATATAVHAQVDPRVRVHVDSMLSVLQYDVSNFEPMRAIGAGETQRQVICQAATIFGLKVNEYISAGMISANDTSVREIRRIGQWSCGSGFE